VHATSSCCAQDSRRDPTHAPSSTPRVPAERRSPPRDYSRWLGKPARWSIVVAAMLAVMFSTIRLEATEAQATTKSNLVAAEPDRLRDTLADPTSEVVRANVVLDSSTVRAVLLGPDSALGAVLVGALARVPLWEGDLVRERARWALGQARDGSLITPLIERLIDDDWRVRAYAAWSLGLARDTRATEPLIAQLEHRVWRVRAMAATALGHIADPSARTAMLGRLSDAAWQVRVGAVEYLGALGDPSLDELIRERLVDRHIAVRSAAAKALGRNAGR
jgi:HEAT repeat protein